MTRHARLAAAALLAISACFPGEDGREAGPTRVFHRGDPASVRLAEQLVWQHLARVEPELAGSLAIRKLAIDDRGRAYARLTQQVAGIPVFGAQMIVELGPDGAHARKVDKLVRDLRVDTAATIDAAQAVALAARSRGLGPRPVRSWSDLQILAGHGKERLAHRIQLDYVEHGQPRRPVVFIDAKTGAVLWSYDNLQTARHRELHDLDHTTALPGPLARVEGGPATGDHDVDVNYGLLGWGYDCYEGLYGRDSFDDAGAALISSVHFSSSYVNAFWNGTQMVYGDGDGVRSLSLATAIDVTSHELTHAVTEHESGLIYIGESGGLNEAMSDIFGNVCEWYRDNGGNVAGPTSPNNYLVGEEIWLSAPALRYMHDPRLDGASLDFWTSIAGDVDVHHSSGIANLAFYLLAEGGTHPRGKSPQVVTGIGIHDAAAIFYRANTLYLTPTSNFSDARAATVEAAADLFGAGSMQVAQTSHAWTAVGVPPPPDYDVIDTRTYLSASGAALHFSYATHGATAIKLVISGGTGDADLYVRFGAPPTLSAWHCRPYLAGNHEACEFNPAQSGTYHVMLVPYEPFSGVTLRVYAAGAGAPSTEDACADGADNDGDGATDCADSDCAADSACAPPTGWTEISSTDFESGMGPFTLGGKDAARVSGSYASSGSYSVRIRDDSLSASSFGLTTGMNLPLKTMLRVQYSEIAAGMEPGKGYYVEMNANGGGWLVIGSFWAGLDLENGVRQARDLQVPLPDTANVKVRFRCQGAQDNDEVYIDDVVISAQ
jgi:Zn-dependent metalloprotease